MGKQFEELDVLDDFLINAVVSDPECGEAFCRRTLSVLLQKPIGEVKIIAQRVIPAPSPKLRGIRMDVEITECEQSEAGEIHNVYDVEPNHRKDVNLPKHNRFYQAKMDSRYMSSGDKDFSKLPNLYVITITNYDPFGEDYMMYTISNSCKEVEDLEYNDGLKFIYFYTGGHKGGNKAIHSLLRYFQNSTKDNVVDENTREIHEYVSKAKLSPKVRDEYMRWYEELQYMLADAREEGRVELLVKPTLSKYRKGKPLPQIAEELEMNVEDIQYIYDAVVKCGSEADVKTICDYIKELKSTV